jgi:hypothetical protein
MTEDPSRYRKTVNLDFLREPEESCLRGKNCFAKRTATDLGLGDARESTAGFVQGRPLRRWPIKSAEYPAHKRRCAPRALICSEPGGRRAGSSIDRTNMLTTRFDSRSRRLVWYLQYAGRVRRSFHNLLVAGFCPDLTGSVERTVLG